MLNLLWFILMLGGIVWGLLSGKAGAVTEAFFAGAEEGVKVALALVGVFSLWGGFAAIAAEIFLGRRGFYRGPWPSFWPGVFARLFGLEKAAHTLTRSALRELPSGPVKTGYLLWQAAGATLFPAAVVGIRFYASSRQAAVIIFPALFVALTTWVTGFILYLFLLVLKGKKAGVR